MPQETRDFLFGMLRLLLRRLASRLKRLKHLPMASLGRFEVLLPLFSLLPGTINFLMRPILDGSDVRRCAFSFLIGRHKAGIAFCLESFELTHLPIAQNLQPVPLLDQILPESVAVAELAVQVGADMFR